MLYDKRKDVRERSIKKILYYRDKVCDPTYLRVYDKKHAINFECSDYFDMVDVDGDSVFV